MKRIYHHHDDCEEYVGGMWRTVSGLLRDELINKASALMMDPQKFEDAMRMAVKWWPNSCEHNLTAQSVNRQAWMGHAGCCLATGSPEDCTRLAWHTLDINQQDLANEAADRVIAHWEAIHAGKDICRSANLELMF